MLSLTFIGYVINGFTGGVSNYRITNPSND